MKKLLSYLLILSFLLQCVGAFSESEKIPEGQFPEMGFSGMNDPNLVSYTEDVIYDSLVSELNSEDYFVENVSAVYISKEYLEEVEFNSQENIYFGYKLSDILDCFQGTKYVFTLGDNGQTVVTEFEEYVEASYEQILKNVAIGTGVILVCVTVSIVSAGAPAISMIFAASAKTGTVMALSDGMIGGVSAGIVKGIETGDMKQALEAAAITGSEQFMWGAVSGSIGGGVSKTISLKGATLGGLSMNEAALIQKESGYPVEVIKKFNNMEQYKKCRELGLNCTIVNGKASLIQKIDLDDFVDESGHTNRMRISQGKSPIDPKSGTVYELHHLDQEKGGVLVMLSQVDHRQGSNYKLWHHEMGLSDVHKDNPNWQKQVRTFWKSYVALMG